MNWRETSLNLRMTLSLCEGLDLKFIFFLIGRLTIFLVLCQAYLSIDYEIAFEIPRRNQDDSKMQSTTFQCRSIFLQPSGHFQDASKPSWATHWSLRQVA